MILAVHSADRWRQRHDSHRAAAAAVSPGGLLPIMKRQVESPSGDLSLRGGRPYVCVCVFLRSSSRTASDRTPNTLTRGSSKVRRAQRRPSRWL